MLVLSTEDLTEILSSADVLLEFVPEVRRLPNLGVLEDDGGPQPPKGGLQPFPFTCVIVLLKLWEISSREFELYVDKSRFLLFKPCPIAVRVSCNVER